MDPGFSFTCGIRAIVCVFAIRMDVSQFIIFLFFLFLEKLMFDYEILWCNHPLIVFNGASVVIRSQKSIPRVLGFICALNQIWSSLHCKFPIVIVVQLFCEMLN